MPRSFRIENTICYFLLYAFLAVNTVLSQCEEASLGNLCGQPCGSGRWMMEGGDLTCKKCPAGYFFNMAAKQCEICPPPTTNHHESVRRNCKDSVPVTKKETPPGTTTQFSSTTSSTSVTDTSSPTPTDASSKSRGLIHTIVMSSSSDPPTTPDASGFKFSSLPSTTLQNVIKGSKSTDTIYIVLACCLVAVFIIFSAIQLKRQASGKQPERL